MNAARQQFEHGLMLWYDYGGCIIFVIADDGWWQVFPGDRYGVTKKIDPPPGMLAPNPGFGHVWSTQIDEVETRLGWATAEEEAARGECGRDENAWHITFGDDYSATLEYPVEQYVPGTESRPSLSGEMWPQGKIVSIGPIAMLERIRELEARVAELEAGAALGLSTL